MQDYKGWKILIPYIIAGTIVLTGCGQEEAPGGVTDVSGALFLSENEDNGEALTIEPPENGETAPETSETPEVSEIAEAAAGAGKVPQARKLTAEECREVEKSVNAEDSYGFLLSVYEKPQDLDAEQVFFIGAGLETEALSEEEREAYLEETGEEEDVNVFRLSAQQIDDHLQYRAGVSLGDLTRQPGWVYLEDYDAYYISHGDEETNVCQFEVTDAAVQGDFYRIHYRVKNNSRIVNGWHTPVYEAILKKNGDSFRFCSNRLWKEKDLLLLPYRSIVTDAGTETELCAYSPDDQSGENADVTFCLVSGGDVACNLPGMNAQNIRNGMTFEEVKACDCADYDGDGSKEIVTIAKYRKSDAAAAREDGLEARVYRFGEDGRPELDLESTKAVNGKVGTLTLSGIAHYLKSGSDRKAFENWKEAFTAEAEEADPESYDRFALIYIDDNRTPELLELGTTPAKGAKIVFFRDGVMEETQISSRFSYMRKENLLHSVNGTENLFEDAIYVYTGSGFEVYQSGIYGMMDAVETVYTKEKTPEYSYLWEGSSVSEAGYRDALRFIYDEQRAVDASKVTTASAEEFLKELKESK